MIESLQFYAKHLAWPLFPCSSRNKAPITEHGFKDASCDLEQIEIWHRLYPECAWGTPTSAERGVIDIDPRHSGDKTLAKLEAEYGELPATPKVRTGGNGWHYWLRFPDGTKSGVAGDGIDRKAEGGYVIIPPSKIEIPEHAGRAYAWEVKPWEQAIAECPVWGLKAEGQCARHTGNGIAPTEDPWIVRAAGDDLLSHEGSPEGERRVTLLRLVGIHLARGDSEKSVLALAEAWAKRCKPAFNEWERHVAGLLRKEAIKMTSPVAFISEDRSNSLVPKAGREQTNSGSVSGSAELVCSLPASAEKNNQGESGVGLSSDWPILQADAFHGLLGDMVRAVEPETEADAVGVLLGFLTCFGSIVGRGAHFPVCGGLHYPGLFVGIVGKTSDAKGDGYKASLWPFREVEPQWASACIANGVGSGEGLVERICDEQQVIDKEGSVKVIQGAPDKRCLLRLSELSRCFKIGRRENATLSEYLREAWDGEPIHIPNRKGNGLSASGYAVSLFGDITPGVVRKLLETGTEAFDGWANRFLWCCVRSPRSLPSGGNIRVLKPFLDRLKTALAFGKNAGEMQRDKEAERLWEGVYDGLKRSGDSVPHTDRARPYAMRLAMLFALADCSKVIRLDHVSAALAVWSYCRQSAQLIFSGKQAEAEPDPLWLRLLNAITSSPGINRTGLREIAGHKVRAEEIEKALASLEAKRLAFKQMVQPKGGGHPAECWFPVEPESDGELVCSLPDIPDGNSDDNTFFLSLNEKSIEETRVGRKPASAELVPSPALRGANSSPADDKTFRRKSGREGTNSALVGEFAPQHDGKGTNSLPDARSELVCSLPVPPQQKAEPEAKGSQQVETLEAGQGGEAGGGVITKAEPVGAADREEQAHFTHEGEGGIGVKAEGGCEMDDGIMDDDFLTPFHSRRRQEP